MIVCTQSDFTRRSIAKLLVAAAIVLGLGEAAMAECVTETLLTAGPPYAEYRLKNTCGGPAIVHWTRRQDNKVEEGRWNVGACSTQDEQYAVGQYSFGDVEFRQGGENDSCLSKGDSAKREKDPNERQREAPSVRPAAPVNPAPVQQGSAEESPANLRRILAESKRTNDKFLATCANTYRICANFNSNDSDKMAACYQRFHPNGQRCRSYTALYEKLRDRILRCLSSTHRPCPP